MASVIKKIFITGSSILILIFAIPLVFVALQLKPLSIPEYIIDIGDSIQKVYSMLYYFIPINHMISCLCLIMVIKHWKLLYYIVLKITDLFINLYDKIFGEK